MLNGIGQSGTLESSDCLITVSPADRFELDYKGGNSMLFEKRTARVVEEVLAAFGESGVHVLIQDQGALEVTLRSRLEVALERAAG